MSAEQKIRVLAKGNDFHPMLVEQITADILAEHTREVAERLKKEFGVTNRAASWLLRRLS